MITDGLYQEIATGLKALAMTRWSVDGAINRNLKGRVKNALYRLAQGILIMKNYFFR